MTKTLNPLAVVHTAIADYRAMNAAHLAALSEYADDDGDIPEAAMPAYDEDRFTYALEADEHLDDVMAALTEAFGLPDDRPVTVLGQWHTRYEVTPGRLDDTARRAFTEGQCHALALALHEVTGWPTTALLTSECWGTDRMCGDESDEECPCRIGHIVVTRPDGAHVDIAGAHAPGAVPQCEGAPALPMTEERWQAIRSTSAWRDADLPLARTFVRPLLASLADASQLTHA
ncbi:hypothetical protein ACIQ9R_36135 [Streptomyces sp. NPDC094447]|uniref:hypothetical protein n=1 Tax=Streptomyces sp. NPDC094447 TaxID=3366062 RepID=UPI003820F9C4